MYVQGKIGYFDINQIGKDSVFNLSQIEVARTNQPNMAGNMYSHIGESAEPSTIITTHFTQKANAKNLSESLHTLPGGVAELFCKVCSVGENVTWDAEVLHLNIISGGPALGLESPYDWYIRCQWTVELHNKSASNNG